MAARRGSPGSLADALETKESGDQGPVPNKRTKIEAAAAELVGGSTTTGSEAKQQGETVAAAAAAHSLDELGAKLPTSPPGIRRGWIEAKQVGIAEGK